VKYGNDKILATIVKDVKELESGVDLTWHSGALIHKRGTNVQLLRDNLGSETGRGVVLRQEGN